MSPLPDVLRIGTRESKLAHLQTERVVTLLVRRFPEIELKLVDVTTSGDRIKHKPIIEVGVQGVFTKELEEALLSGQVDLIVHSLKDMPTETQPGLVLAAFLDRQDPRDVLVSLKGDRLNQLPRAARVATSSRRRSAQLAAIRPDLRFVDIRGNVDTRLRKLDEGQCDAIVLAAAGLIRLGLTDRITEYFNLAVCTPAVGQGALAAECRTADTAICDVLKALDDPEVREHVIAEREFLSQLGGGCSIPVGACCQTDEAGNLELTVCISSLDGKNVIRASGTDKKGRAVALGRSLAAQVTAQGAREILAPLRQSLPNVISAP